MFKVISDITSLPAFRYPFLTGIAASVIYQMYGPVWLSLPYCVVISIIPAIAISPFLLSRYGPMIILAGLGIIAIPPGFILGRLSGGFMFMMINFLRDSESTPQLMKYLFLL